MYGIPDSLLALVFIGVLLLLAKLGEEIFEKFRLVSYVAAIVIGIIIGPGVLGAYKHSPKYITLHSLGDKFPSIYRRSPGIQGYGNQKFLNPLNIITGILEFILPFSLISFIVYYIFHSVTIALIVGHRYRHEQCRPCNKASQGHRAKQYRGRE
jgi:transporter, CPA2 family (2.A.37)